MVANGLHRKAVYDEFDGKGLVSSSLTMFLLYSRDLTEKGQSLKKFVKYIKNRVRYVKISDGFSIEAYLLTKNSALC